MNNVDVRVEGAEALLSLDKQLVFAAARALTEAAKQVQSASIAAIKSTFTTRGRWYEPGNRFGVKVRPARKDNLEALVGTAADWLALHETSGTKIPQGSFIAIPTTNVRRNKRQIIPRAQRPRNLKRAFVIKTRTGVMVLFQRKGRGGRSDIVAMYILEPRARIKKESTIVVIAEKVVSRRFAPLFDKSFREALASAKGGGDVREAKGVWAFD